MELSNVPCRAGNHETEHEIWMSNCQDITQEGQETKCSVLQYIPREVATERSGNLSYSCRKNGTESGTSKCIGNVNLRVKDVAF